MLHRLNHPHAQRSHTYRFRSNCGKVSGQVPSCWLLVRRRGIWCRVLLLEHDCPRRIDRCGKPMFDGVRWKWYVLKRNWTLSMTDWFCSKREMRCWVLYQYLQGNCSNCAGNLVELRLRRRGDVRISPCADGGLVCRVRNDACSVRGSLRRIRLCGRGRWVSGGSVVLRRTSLPVHGYSSDECGLLYLSCRREILNSHTIDRLLRIQPHGQRRHRCCGGLE